MIDRDHTYIPMARGFYLTAVVDVASRRVLAHKVAITILSDNPNVSFLIDKVAPGRGCSHKPMREIMEQLRTMGKP